MTVLTDLADFPKAARGGVLCIGNFDGVHAGHRAMLSRAREVASSQQLPLTVMTFDPHPSALLRPGHMRKPLTTLAQRQELLLAFQPRVLAVLPFTRDLLSMPAETFLASIVRDTIAAKHLVEGPTFTFGRGAQGTSQTLREQAGEFGFDAHIVPAQQVTLSDLTHVNVSSTLIRWLIEQGRVDDAARCLGRPYALRGVVVHGHKRGRTIGFPTANLDCPQLIPAPGVYAGAAISRYGTHRAAISVGTNPTFNGQQTTVEAYLLDFDADLYDQTIDITFHRWLREQVTYGGVDPLVRQLQRDVEDTRRLTTI